MTGIPETMSGVILTGHGGPETLEWRDDLPVPRPAPGDVLIRVAAAGVNNTDLNTRIGWYSKGEGDAEDDGGWAGALNFPRIQGADVCGHVAAIGDGVDPSRLGERVLIEPCLREWEGRPLERAWYFGSECDGGFAQFTRVPARHAHAVRTDHSDVELAAVPCSWSTAENMLTRAGLKAGETILVTGASGGVGSAAVQLARARGAIPVAVARADKADALRDMGAERVVARGDDLSEALGPNSADVVVDLVGGPDWPRLLDVLRPFGRYAVSGAIAGAFVELDLRTLYLKDLSFFGCTVIEPEVFPNLIAHLEAGRVRPAVSATYPLQDIAQAQTAFEEKRHVGKIVLTLDGIV